MMCLLCMAWTMMFYASYLTGHATRCAVAARHAAWAAGNGTSADAATLGNDIFWNNKDLVRLTATTAQTSDASGMLSGNAIVEAILSIFPDIRKADVEFGLTGSGTSTAWPFVLTNVQFPFMPESGIDTLLKVQCHCEWDSVNENWDSIGDIFTSIIEGIFR